MCLPKSVSDTASCLPPPGCSYSGAGGDLHPGHDGAGLHGAAQQEAQGHHHEKSRPGEVQANAHGFTEVERYCNKLRA